jgi:chromosome segregation ATPase
MEVDNIKFQNINDIRDVLSALEQVKMELDISNDSNRMNQLKLKENLQKLESLFKTSQLVKIEQDDYARNLSVSAKEIDRVKEEIYHLSRDIKSSMHDLADKIDWSEIKSKIDQVFLQKIESVEIVASRIDDAVDKLYENDSKLHNRLENAVTNFSRIQESNSLLQKALFFSMGIVFTVAVTFGAIAFSDSIKIVKKDRYVAIVINR